MRPILADSDIGQIVVFLVVALIAFVQWLFKLLKEKMGETGRSPRVSTDEEEEARNRAWREQTRQAAPPVESGGMLNDLMGELRKSLEPVREQRAPARPPLLPQPAPSFPARPLAPPLPVLEGHLSNIPVLQTLSADRDPHPLTALLRTAGGYRQAFVLREVLGPPRALQEYAGPD